MSIGIWIQSSTTNLTHCLPCSRQGHPDLNKSVNHAHLEKQVKPVHPGPGWQESKTSRALPAQRRVQVRLLGWPPAAPLREQTTFSAACGLETAAQSRGTGTYWPILADCWRSCSQALRQVASRHCEVLSKGSPSEGRTSPSFQESPSGLQRPWNQLPLPSSILDKSFEHLYLFYFKPKGQKWNLLLTRTQLWTGLTCDPYIPHPKPLMEGQSVTFLVLSPPSSSSVLDLWFTCPHALPVCFLISYLFIIITCVCSTKNCGFRFSCFSLIRVLLNEIQWGYWCKLLSR